ncbi:MAG: glycosyltransferase [Actinomycetota bacterium]|nr:glycosyltransferase [Actinomycetota bacterium]
MSLNRPDPGQGALAAFARPLNIMMNAGPWLAVPPGGYGGIENVVATLVPELRARGHRVVLASVGDSSLPVDDLVYAFRTGQFPLLAAPYNASCGIAPAHLQAVARAVRAAQDAGRPFDLIHDHMEVVGPAMLGALGDGPPILQTLHWDLHKHPDFYGRFDGRGRVFFAGVSQSQIDRAPDNLAGQTIGYVPLAVAQTDQPAAGPTEREDHLLVLGRITPLKGCDVAVRLCQDRGHRLVLAGPVGGLPDAAALESALADPTSPVRDYPDVRYFLDKIAPHLDGSQIRWIGSVHGRAKDDLIRRARAVLFPLQWEEPGGTAMVEALSLGTPVVGLARGVLPSLVDHGSTGWIARSEAELAGYLDRLDELDPVACQRVARQRFSPDSMAAAYEALYLDVLARSRWSNPTSNPADHLGLEDGRQDMATALAQLG